VARVTEISGAGKEAVWRQVEYGDYRLTGKLMIPMMEVNQYGRVYYTHAAVNTVVEDMVFLPVR
jgi:hypothetical protein